MSAVLYPTPGKLSKADRASSRGCLMIFGMLLDTVDRLNLWENTMVIFTSDHGEQLGDHNLYSKFVMRESSLHIPFMVYHPDIESGVRESLVEQVDVMPTICDFLGAETPNDIDGKSLKSILESNIQPDNWRTEVFAQLGNDKMIRSKEWKLVCYDNNPYEFYDIKNDPHELINLASDLKFSKILDNMISKLNKK